MSIIEPKIDELLDVTDNDRFLLCSLASKRAHDINDMMRGQRERATSIPKPDGGSAAPAVHTIQHSTAVQIARANNKKPLSIGFSEIARGDVSFDPNSFDIKNH